MASEERKLTKAAREAVGRFAAAQTAYLDAWHELCRHRLFMLSKGEEPEIDVALLPSPPPILTPPDQARREQLARVNAEIDAAVRRGRNTKHLFVG
jgi:hypothetical protein